MPPRSELADAMASLMAEASLVEPSHLAPNAVAENAGKGRSLPTKRSLCGLCLGSKL